MLAAIEVRYRCSWPDLNGRPTDYELATKDFAGRCGCRQDLRQVLSSHLNPPHCVGSSLRAFESSPLQGVYTEPQSAGQTDQAHHGGNHTPGPGQSLIRDQDSKGFGLRITANGVRSFFVEKRIDGKVKRLTLGR